MQRLLQFTLDLFEPTEQHPGAQPAAKPPGRKKNGNFKPESPRIPELQASSAAEDTVDARHAEPPRLTTLAPEQTLQEALAPVTFCHPRASRETLLGGVLVAYEFKRGKRRTIGFSVGPDGLAVSAPKWVPLYDIDKAVAAKAAWILAKLQQTRDRHQVLELARIDWKDGASFRFLGRDAVVVLDPGYSFAGAGAELKPDCGTRSDTGAGPLALQVALPRSASADQIRDAVQAWLMRQAKRLFTERLDHFAPTLKVQWRKLSLSSAGTRWGSASADGSIRLNWRLIHFRLSVIDYVVVHELSHLRVMDHSPLFWDTVRSVVPEFADLRRQLKQEPVPKW
jgi:hypothetical protein